MPYITSFHLIFFLKKMVITEFITLINSYSLTDENFLIILSLRNTLCLSDDATTLELDQSDVNIHSWQNRTQA